jgi:hypothetical protein
MDPRPIFPVRADRIELLGKGVEFVELLSVERLRPPYGGRFPS